jgi:hypothetical protein
MQAANEDSCARKVRERFRLGCDKKEHAVNTIKYMEKVYGRRCD